MDRCSRNKEYVILIICVIISIAVLSAALYALLKGKDTDGCNFDLTFEYPEHWDVDYIESVDDYAIIRDNIVCETFYTNQEFEAESSTSLSDSYIASTSIGARDERDTRIAMLNEKDAWYFISDGIWSDYPKGSFADNKSNLSALQKTCTTVITINCWYWENPKDATNLTKITTTKKFAVNSKLADTFLHIFEDIYNDPSKPVLNIDDKGMGTWVLRGKNHNDNNTMSAHAVGCAIDINPSTGSFKINGKWYGNGYGHSVMSYRTWQQLPECQTKYHVLYDGCPIVEIFKSYGFYWGGDWSSTKDCMHLAYIGDGKDARSIGISNYSSRQ